ncbi:DNA-binding response regulator [Nostocoides sp. F2B08]|uniref:winged helix-turn-helix transcriptional regulator n=1 Tax=Nostocoides sp. F2B08 TaxID=2653936 RepID=UPI001263293B|nr:response regulator transcription factor [Tetrasphaera sp. F2B08]KAB7745100.1 DNA-binding response regulator [Tetrasphaera sp. F2B08]
MAQVVLLTSALGPSAEVLPALGLLTHHVSVAPAEASALIDSTRFVYDLVLVDARTELVAAKSLCRVLRTTGLSAPLLAILTEGGLAGLTSEWGVDDVVLATAGPAEVEARFRLALGRTSGDEPEDPQINLGPLSIDEAAYSARLRGRPLDLTYKEFELLKYLAQHPGRVFTRSQLLQEVWGYDYFGGTRTVDVHVRRLRAKLGADHEVLIGTVRNVGYRFVPEEAPEENADLDVPDRVGRRS